MARRAPRDIAAEFGMSERTFARRLAEEGTTFSQLLDRLRLELARRYLLNDGLAISKVAWLLGYQEVGAFSHAFRRWTGQSPSEVARRGLMALPLGPISRPTVASERWVNEFPPSRAGLAVAIPR